MLGPLTGGQVRTRSGFWAVLAAVAALTTFGAAPRAQPSTGDLVSFGLGYFDVNKRRDPATEARLEYLSAANIWRFKPFLGLMVNTDNASYVYGGVRLEISLGGRFLLVPSFAPGLYDRGNGKDLGHVVEFRSQIEVAYLLDRGARLGLSLNHMSNASLGDRNPGTENVALTLSIPLGVLGGLLSK